MSCWGLRESRGGQKEREGAWQDPEGNSITVACVRVERETMEGGSGRVGGDPLACLLWGAIARCVKWKRGVGEGDEEDSLTLDPLTYLAPCFARVYSIYFWYDINLSYL